MSKLNLSDTLLWRRVTLPAGLLACAAAIFLAWAQFPTINAGVRVVLETRPNLPSVVPALLIVALLLAGISTAVAAVKLTRTAAPAQAMAASTTLITVLCAVVGAPVAAIVAGVTAVAAVAAAVVSTLTVRNPASLFPDDVTSFDRGPKVLLAVAVTVVSLATMVAVTYLGLGRPQSVPATVSTTGAVATGTSSDAKVAVLFGLGEQKSNTMLAVLGDSMPKLVAEGKADIAYQPVIPPGTSQVSNVASIMSGMYCAAEEAAHGNKAGLVAYMAASGKAANAGSPTDWAAAAKLPASFNTCYYGGTYDSAVRALLNSKKLENWPAVPPRIALIANKDGKTPPDAQVKSIVDSLAHTKG